MDEITAAEIAMLEAQRRDNIELLFWLAAAQVASWWAMVWLLNRLLGQSVKEHIEIIKKDPRALAFYRAAVMGIPALIIISAFDRYA